MDLGNTLAALNASLNGLAAVLMAFGWVAIKMDRRIFHRNLMMAAFSCSILFLISYLTRVAISGIHPYPHGGILKTIYLTILVTHVILAMSVPFLTVRVIFLALKNRLTEHRRLARVAYPIWLYVSVTGVIIYFMLYTN